MKIFRIICSRDHEISSRKSKKIIIKVTIKFKWTFEVTPTRSDMIPGILRDPKQVDCVGRFKPETKVVNRDPILLVRVDRIPDNSERLNWFWMTQSVWSWGKKLQNKFYFFKGRHNNKFSISLITHRTATTVAAARVSIPTTLKTRLSLLRHQVWTFSQVRFTRRSTKEVLLRTLRRCSMRRRRREGLAPPFEGLSELLAMKKNL